MYIGILYLSYYVVTIGFDLYVPGAFFISDAEVFVAVPSMIRGLTCQMSWH
jgi:hypothetical protein